MVLRTALTGRWGAAVRVVKAWLGPAAASRRRAARRHPPHLNDLLCSKLGKVSFNALVNLATAGGGRLWSSGRRWRRREVGVCVLLRYFR